MAESMEVDGQDWCIRMDAWLDLRGPNVGQWEAGTFIQFKGERSTS